MQKSSCSLVLTLQHILGHNLPLYYSRGYHRRIPWMQLPLTCTNSHVAISRKMIGNAPKSVYHVGRDRQLIWLTFFLSPHSLLACPSAMVRKHPNYDLVLSVGPCYVEFFHRAWQKTNQHFPIGSHPPPCTYRSMRSTTPLLSNPLHHSICLPLLSSLPFFPTSPYPPPALLCHSPAFYQTALSFKVSSPIKKTQCGRAESCMYWFDLSNMYSYGFGCIINHGSWYSDVGIGTCQR